MSSCGTCGECLIAELGPGAVSESVLRGMSVKSRSDGARMVQLEV